MYVPHTHAFNRLGFFSGENKIIVIYFTGLHSFSIIMGYGNVININNSIQFNSQIILIPPSLIENPLREGAHSSLLIWESIKICTQSETGGILIWP